MNAKFFILFKKIILERFKKYRIMVLKQNNKKLLLLLKTYGNKQVLLCPWYCKRCKLESYTD